MKNQPHPALQVLSGASVDGAAMPREEALWLVLQRLQQPSEAPRDAPTSLSRCLDTRNGAVV